MDAVKFLKELVRMNKEMDIVGKVQPLETIDAEEFVEEVEKWSKEHPKKTNREKFLEVFGDVDTKKFMGIEWQWQRWLDQEYKGEEG